MSCCCTSRSRYRLIGLVTLMYDSRPKPACMDGFTDNLDRLKPYAAPNALDKERLLIFSMISSENLPDACDK